jgi:hypothetical protein
MLLFSWQNSRDLFVRTALEVSRKREAISQIENAAKMKSPQTKPPAACHRSNTQIYKGNISM